MLKTSPMYVL